MLKNLEKRKKGVSLNCFKPKKSFEAMLEMCKEVLTKVSFDRLLFKKELHKAIHWMKGEDLPKLKQWCLEHFGNLYHDIIIASFQPVAM